MTERSRIEEITHQVNNLLATIQVQSEVANAVGTLEAAQQALHYITECANRTRDHLAPSDHHDHP